MLGCVCASIACLCGLFKDDICESLDCDVSYCRYRSFTPPHTIAPRPTPGPTQAECVPDASLWPILAKCNTDYGNCNQGSNANAPGDMADVDEDDGGFGNRNQTNGQCECFSDLMDCVIGPVIEADAECLMETSIYRQYLDLCQNRLRCGDICNVYMRTTQPPITTITLTPSVGDCSPRSMLEVMNSCSGGKPCRTFNAFTGTDSVDCSCISNVTRCAQVSFRRNGCDIKDAPGYEGCLDVCSAEQCTGRPIGSFPPTPRGFTPYAITWVIEVTLNRTVQSQTEFLNTFRDYFNLPADWLVSAQVVLLTDSNLEEEEDLNEKETVIRMTVTDESAKILLPGLVQASGEMQQRNNFALGIVKATAVMGTQAGTKEPTEAPSSDSTITYVIVGVVAVLVIVVAVVIGVALTRRGSPAGSRHVRVAGQGTGMKSRGRSHRSSRKLSASSDGLKSSLSRSQSRNVKRSMSRGNSFLSENSCAPSTGGTMNTFTMTQMQKAAAGGHLDDISE